MADKFFIVKCFIGSVALTTRAFQLPKTCVIGRQHRAGRVLRRISSVRRVRHRGEGQWPG
jgi:hypothetical protein